MKLPQVEGETCPDCNEIIKSAGAIRLYCGCKTDKKTMDKFKNRHLCPSCGNWDLSPKKPITIKTNAISNRYADGIDRGV